MDLLTSTNIPTLLRREILRRSPLYSVEAPDLISSASVSSATQGNRITAVKADGIDESEDSGRSGSSTRIRQPRPIFPLANSNDASVRYTSPGQRVVVNFGSADPDALRAARHTSTKQRSGNVIRAETTKSNQSSKTSNSPRVIAATAAESSTEEPIQQTSPLTNARSSTKNPPTTSSTYLTTELTTVSDGLETTQESEDFSTDSLGYNDDITTEEVTTIRPLKLRPLVRRPGFRRRVRPRNRQSTFNPRERSGSRIIKTKLGKVVETTSAAEPSTITTETPAASTTAKNKELAMQKKKFETEDLIEKVTSGSAGQKKRLM